MPVFSQKWAEPAYYTKKNHQVAQLLGGISLSKNQAPQRLPRDFFE